MFQRAMNRAFVCDLEQSGLLSVVKLALNSDCAVKLVNPVCAAGFGVLRMHLVVAHIDAHMA